NSRTASTGSIHARWIREPVGSATSEPLRPARPPKSTSAPSSSSNVTGESSSLAAQSQGERICSTVRRVHEVDGVQDRQKPRGWSSAFGACSESGREDLHFPVRRPAKLAGVQESQKPREWSRLP